jgi:hypothetical protein
MLVGSHDFTTQAAASPGEAAFEPSNPIPNNLYMPIVFKQHPYFNLFGVEANSSFYPDNFLTKAAVALGGSYVRLNGRISWRELQPEESDPINWDLLAGFETELRTLRAANITPIVIVIDYPRWATDNTVREDGVPTSCGPLLPERYDDFARFMQALVQRYMVPEFNVHIWEMGNEPDIDPNLIVPDSHFGCWGDANDPFYNGRAYGQMLRTVAPVIRAMDPRAQIWVGGLLLDSPNTVDGNIGQPEDFFRGILETGAATSFDVVAYHAYIRYRSNRTDRDITSETAWDALGGILRGKARFLRTIMEEYDIDKPLFITETGQICDWCDQYPSYLLNFFDMQANMPARSFPRAMSEDISGFIWYTLDGPGWNNGGLLDENQAPKPAYLSYQAFINIAGHANFTGPAYWGEGIEAYAYYHGSTRIDIIFSILDVTYTLEIPQNGFIAVYDRFGVPIPPQAVGQNYLLTIRYEPIYLVRSR